MPENPLARYGDGIRDRWLDAIWASYPAESLRLFRDTSDRFANPVGAAYRRSTAAVVHGLLAEVEVATLEADLEPMVRVRAVQELKPSQAVAHVLCLKELARAEVSAAADDLPEQVFAAFEERVDQLLLVAFDLYMKCREEIFSIRVKEIRNRSLKTMERLNEWRERRPATMPGHVDETG